MIHSYYGIFTTLIITCLYASQYLIVNGAVAGVDFGGEFFKIALVKPGRPFEIVTNIHSKRKTETMVAFDGEDRLYGADASSFGVRRPKQSYSQIRRLLGLSLEHPEIVSLTQNEYFPHELVHNFSRGTVGLKHKEDHVFHSEELVAMVFSHARDITDSFAEGKVKDWVVTVPSFFVEAQRQAIIDAAEVAGIRVLSLMDENTAAALQYGIDRVYEKPFRVMYYNLGSTSLQVSIVEYDSYVVPDGFKKNKTVGNFKVLSKAWDASLGGSKFDLRLTEFFIKKFEEQMKEKNIDLNVREVPKLMSKLRTQARKTKLVLSANENIPVTLPSLYKDIDLHTHINRKEFEVLCEDLVDRSIKPVEKALEEAGLKVEDIDELEIIGGGVRMPMIQRKLKEKFNGKELSVHLNGDEAMALGSAFFAANISKSFRVRTVGMTDITPFPVGVRLVDLHHAEEQKDSSEEKKAWVKRATLFNKYNKLNSRKSVSFMHDKDISCTFRYDQPTDLPSGAHSIISHWDITGIEEFAHSKKNITDEAPKVILSFTLDSSGIASIAKAEVTLEEEYEAEEVVKKSEKDDKKTQDKEESKTEDGKDEEKEEKKEEEKKEENEEGKEENVEKKLVKKKRIHRATLTVSRTKKEYEAGMSIIPMSIKDKKDSIALLSEMERRDQIRRENAEAENALESSLYRIRDQLSTNEEALKSVSTEEQVEEVRQQTVVDEEWLYDEGAGSDASVYKARLNSLNEKVKPIFFRLSELTKRPDAVQKVKSFIRTTKSTIEEWLTTKPQIEASEREDVLKRLNEIDEWIKEKLAKQEETPGYEAPVVTSSEILDQMTPVKRLVKTLSKRPKPEPKVEDKNNTTTDETNSTETEGTKESTDETTIVDEEKKSEESTTEETKKEDPASVKEEL